MTGTETVWQRRRLIINAASSILQIGLNSVVLFVLYKFLLNSIGVEKLGIWSLVLAASSVTMISNFGLTGSIVKYVAKHLALGDRQHVSSVVQTALISVSVLTGAALIIGFPILRYILAHVIPDQALPLAWEILPNALIALWLMVLTGICQGGLDGCQRIDIRNIILLAATVINLVLSLLLAPKYQLLGLSYAKILGNAIALFASWMALKRILPELPLFPKHWRANIFREIVGYGASFQLISLMAMLFDPITKAFLSKFGSLSTVGYYEMANKMVVQARSLIVSACQAIVPVIADIKERDPHKILAFYRTSYQLMFFLSLPLFTMIVVGTPLISILWIGHYEGLFMIASALLATGWFFNTLNVPAYVTYLGIGELRWPVLGQMAIALLNIILGFALGTLSAGPGVITAWAIALTLGSSVVYVSFHKNNKIRLAELVPTASTHLVLSCLAVIAAFFVTFRIFFARKDVLWFQIVSVLLCGALLAAAVWFHPMRRRLTTWVTVDLLKRDRIQSI